MAIRAIGKSANAAAYASLRRVAPPPEAVDGVAPSPPTRETLRRPQLPGTEGPAPYPNAEGQITGTIVNTVA